MRFVATIMTDRLIARGSVEDGRDLTPDELAAEAMQQLRRDGERNNSFLRSKASEDMGQAADFEHLVARFGDVIREAVASRVGRVETATAQRGGIAVRPGDFRMVGTLPAAMTCRIEVLDDDAVAAHDRMIADILA